MQTITVKNGRIVSPVSGWHGEAGDLLIQDGKIVSAEKEIAPQGTVIDAGGRYVTPGFIDIHTHCYPGVPLGMDPDKLGIGRGVTSIFDAGSSGADNYADFRENYIDRSKTKVFTLLNLSKEGLIRGHELDSLEKLDVDAMKRTIAENRDNIVGIKVRASASCVGDMGIVPIEMATAAAHELHIPLMIHVGHYPPALTDVLNLVKQGDVITHAFHGKVGGILNEDGTIIDEALRARERGACFDIGHGAESFSFRTFEKALKAGFDCDMISSDLHIKNYNGPVYSLISVASKMVNCGVSFEDVVNRCTHVPAAHFGLEGLGSLAPGMTADIAIMSLDPCDELIRDSIGDELRLTRKLVVNKTILSRGNKSEIFEYASSEQ